MRPHHDQANELVLLLLLRELRHRCEEMKTRKLATAFFAEKGREPEAICEVEDGEQPQACV